MSSAQWPPAEGLFTPTVARKDVILPVHSRTVIEAPASLVWRVLLDTSKYGEWNPFVPEVKIESQPDGSTSSTLQLGTVSTFMAVIDPKKPKSYAPTQVRIVDFSTPEAPSSYISAETLNDPVFTSDLTTVYRISWKTEGGFAARGLSAERFHEIIILDDNKCEVRTWETMGGVLARLVKWTYGSVLPLRAAAWSDGLKKFCEELAVQGNSA